VLEYDTFSHWEETLNGRKFRVYAGPTFVVYNEKNDCLAQLNDQRAELAVQSWTIPKLRDEALSNWLENVEKQYVQATIVKQVRAVNYVYCHPGHITVDNERRICDNRPEKLLASTSFHTSDLGYCVTQNEIQIFRKH